MKVRKRVKKIVYVFDTSVFLVLHVHNTQVIELPKEIWDVLDRMIKSGQIISHFYVYEEVVNEKAEKPDMMTKWLIPKKQYFEKENEQQVIYVSKIIKKFPKLIDPSREKEQADPWIIAQAITFNKQTNLLEDAEYVVATQENQNSTVKIPAACRNYKIRCLSLKDFFGENNIKIAIAQ